ncbi:MAG TPA: helicase, partial [Roseiflexaceae bacterium]|nr:helicase [Roseiflexaceae bacterium]
MQSIADTIQAIARQRGRGDAGPLIALRQLDGAPGERISHLPVDRDLAQAWPAMTGEPFRPHQAQALASLRRGEPVALRASSADVASSAYLLLYAALTDERFATALILAPDEAEALAIHARLGQLNADLPASLRLTATLVAPGQRPDPYARVVVAAPEALHGRLLRHHDRAWRLFWPAARLIILPDIQRHTGVAGAHLADLLLRSLRIIAGHGGAGATLVATLTEVAEPEPALTSLLGQPWRVVAADDGPRGAPLLAVWHAGSARLRESADLALALQRQGYHVHIACGPLEQAAITPVVGETPGISAGPGAPAAQVLVSAGYPGSTSALRRLLRSGYQAVVVVLGDLPHEQAIARHVETLISGPPAAWPPPPANAYVTAQHVLCAASELPLTAAEIDAWRAQDVVERLAAHRQLVDLPDAEEAWKPADAAGDPYADFTPLAASGAPIRARTEQGALLGSFDPTGFERWTFPGAALPPGAGGMRVLMRDDDHGTITLRMETSGRRTYPLRRCTVEVRETRETRALAGGKQLSWGRVVVSEEVYGYREAAGGQAAVDMALKAPLAARWVAPACWFDVGIDLQLQGQFVGWSLAATLPLRTLAAFTDVVPCYDQATRRLYLVDAQPGGSGLAVWIYGRAEELLPLAYDVALACRSDPLLEPLSRVDQDWLLALLGRSIERRPSGEERRPRSADRGAPTEEHPRTDDRQPRDDDRARREERR